MDNKMTLSFISKSSNEGFARAAVAAFATQLDPTLEDLADIKTAVSEAVTNAIVHGYGHPNGIITVSCVLSGKSITITVHDEGRGILNVQQAMQPLFTQSEDTERSGMGFTVMEAFMDSITVDSTIGQGTIVTLTKKINNDIMAP